MVIFSMKFTKEQKQLILEAQNIVKSIFEVDSEKRLEDTNKVSRKVKNKDGEEVEVVSVRDELFPYEGSKKEQFKKKVVAKINDVIEGTATIDDLIRLVQSKK